ncbi:hypothetical protein RA280_43565 [Cupriavidus sp. CV2]|uniref:hypothetical protein n=1 Tax=Cupriavidus ulmosensis TaxID=3065913 RepID=UPI00296ACA00|nr:hypothetical protein [Cupriavidus sp. CV2]MDW3688487.1 hypothetical protein [Cupriavidus sp. CV2]
MYNELIQAFLRASATIEPAGFKKFYRRLVVHMIEQASIQFGIAGMPLAIDETRIPVAGHPNIWEAIRAGVTPDLDQFWSLLRDTYEEKGTAIAYRQAASTLVAALGLTHPAAVRRSSKIVRLRLEADSEAVAMAARPSRRLRANCREPVGAAIAALAVFAQEAGAGPLARCLRQFEYGEVFLAQQRRTFPEVDVIQFNEYWELRFNRPLAEQLLQLVSRHAGLPNCNLHS